MKPKIALFGAGGKMGCRITDNLLKFDYELVPVETAPAGIERLESRGLKPYPFRQAIVEADFVILALPDTLLGEVSFDVVPFMQPKSTLMVLDPAAAHARVLMEREDVCLFVTHPCHPPLWNDESGQAKDDFFGGIAAKQNIVCAIERGSDEDYLAAESLARSMYAPVVNAHRITVEQMAILEPAMAETVTAMCCTIIHEAYEQAILRGVPAAAAWDFIMGHTNIPLGIVFGQAGNPFSDGAKLIIEYGRERIIRPDWKKVFEPESIREQVQTIVQGRLPT
jgi:hypothetical protein